MPKTNKQTVAVEVAAAPKQIQVPTDEAMREQGMSSLSARIRHLASLGVSTAEITKVVKRSNGRHPIYQHVRNVLNTPLKRVETPAQND
jgi:hypothetical protein